MNAVGKAEKTMSAFEIQILEQHWLGEEDPAYDSSLVDMCSHGKIRLVIGGRLIEDGFEEYGIGESAFHLLKTLEGDYQGPEFVAGPLICHGCGAMLGFNCNIGIDWRVQHLGHEVRLDQVVRYDSNDLKLAKQIETSASLASETYRVAIVSFASHAKEFFRGIKKRILNDLDREDYDRFWRDYDRLLSRYAPQK